MSDDVLYSLVRSQLEALLARFRLHEPAAQLIGAYELLSKESLAIPPNRRRNFSTINDDGMPFQFSLGLGPGGPALQFLGEAGGAEMSAAERMTLNRERMVAMAALLGCDRELSRCQSLLNALAPATGAELAAARGGMFWIGAGARAGEPPRLQIYINSCRGGDAADHRHLDAFAANFAATGQWAAQKKSLEGRMNLLGVSITLSGGRPSSGRIYLRGYGNPLSYYEDLARRAAGDACAAALRESVHVLLSDDCSYPTRSVVCSFGFGDGGAPDFKCEFCAHCVFANDAEAVARCSAWLAPFKTHLDAYSSMVRTVAGERIGASTRGLHSFVGVGFRRRQPYYTVYLNPGAAASAGEAGTWTHAA